MTEETAEIMSAPTGTGAAGVMPVRPDPAALKQSSVLLFSCLLLGVLADILFYGKTLGISYPLFAAALYAVFFCNLKGIARRGSMPGRVLIIFIFALAATFALHSNIPLLVLNFLIIPFLLVAQTILTAGANRFHWYDLRFILDILEGIIGRTLLHLSVPFRLIGEGFKKRTDHRRYDTIRKVATGLLVSLPLLLVVVMLLSNADAVFNHYLGWLPELLGRVKLGEALVRTIIVLLAALISFAYIYSFRAHGKEKEGAGRPPAGPPQLKKWLDPLTVSTFLIVLNLVYVFFALIQFSYLFGGGRLALPAGFTYAEYARQGFFELIAVTVINFSVFTFVINLAANDKRALFNVVRFLLTLLSVSTLIMLASAFFRLSLYEEAYGFTYARVTAHAFMVYLFILFLAALYRIWQERVSLLKIFIAVTAVAYLSFNFFGIDRFTAAANIDRYFDTGKIDVFYLTHLSDDAVPQLTRLLAIEDEEITRFMENNLYERKRRLSGQRWQSFNWSRHKAGSVLDDFILRSRVVERVPNRG